MLFRSAILTGFVCFSAAAATFASAQTQLSPIVVRPAIENPNCQIYLGPDGRRLLFKGKPISAGGSCPSDYMRGTVTRIAPDSYRLRVSGTDCMITPTGLGQCR